MQSLDELRAQQGHVELPNTGVENEQEGQQDQLSQDSQESNQDQSGMLVQPTSDNRVSKKEEGQSQMGSVSETPAERQWKSVREKARRYDQLEREHREAQRKLAEYESLRAPQVEEEDFSISPDEIAEGKHLNKVVNKFEKRIKQLESALDGYQKQSVTMSAEARLKAEYPDINKVVNADTIASLSEQYPELASTINSSSDFYNKAVSAYTLIKKLGIYTEDNYAYDRAKAVQNSSKPRSLNSITPQQGESPLARANAFTNDLTPESKQQYWKEMQAAMKAR